MSIQATLEKLPLVTLRDLCNWNEHYQFSYETAESDKGECISYWTNDFESQRAPGQSEQAWVNEIITDYFIWKGGIAQ